MKAKECPIRVQDKVLFKRDVVRKDVSPWDPDPFTVVEIKGSLITANRQYPRYQCKTRNSFNFKLYRGLDMNESFHESTSTTAENNREGQIVEEIAEPETSTAEVEYSSLQSGENPINSTAQQEVHSSFLTNAARNKGRPLKAVSERLGRERQEKLRIQQTENPSARRSSRLAANSNGQTLSFLRGGKMSCLASRHD